MASRKQLIDTMQKLQKINIETISAERRTKCLASIDRRYEQLKENANDLLDTSNRKLDNGDLMPFQIAESKPCELIMK